MTNLNWRKVVEESVCEENIGCHPHRCVCAALEESVDEIERLLGQVAELQLTGDRKELQAMLDQLGLDFERMRDRAIIAEDEIERLREELHQYRLDGDLPPIERRG